MNLLYCIFLFLLSIIFFQMMAFFLILLHHFHFMPLLLQPSSLLVLHLLLLLLALMPPLFLILLYYQILVFFAIAYRLCSCTKFVLQIPVHCYFHTIRKTPFFDGEKIFFFCKLLILQTNSQQV